jgi:hypothetical protein
VDAPARRRQHARRPPADRGHPARSRRRLARLAVRLLRDPRRPRLAAVPRREPVAPTRQIQPVEQDGDTLTAIDARIGVAFGKTLWRTLGPYVAARAFGGPVSWKFRGEDTTGTDDYHVQLGAGLVATTPVGLDVFAEIVPLGERAVTAGAGWSW